MRNLVGLAKIFLVTVLLSAQSVHADDGPQNSPAPVLNLRDGFSEILTQGRLDAVVNIAASLKRAPQNMPEMQIPDSGPLRDFFRDFFSFDEDFQGGRAPKVTSLGSGFVVSADGYIVTNYHVVKHVLVEKRTSEDKGEIIVTFKSGTELPAKIVGTDPHTDLALLKVKTKKDLPYLSWGDSAKAKVGHFALAIGNPFGLGGTVTAGIISKTDRDASAKMERGETTHVDRWIQMDAAVNQGNSGGPLINTEGNVIGINTAILTPSGGNVGIAFAIPSAIARPVIEQLKNEGCVHRGYIGVRLGSPLTDETAAAFGLASTKGALIDDVIPGGAAEEAGIQPGDVILKIGNQVIENPEHLRSIVSSLKEGYKATFTIWRSRAQGNKRMITLGIRIADYDKGTCRVERKGNRPGSWAEKTGKVLGVDVISLEQAPHLKGRFGLPKDLRSGMVVTAVDPRSPVSDQLFPGDVLLEVAGTGQPISSVEAFKSAIDDARAQKRTTLLVLLWRGTGRTSAVLRIDSADSD